MKKVNFYSFMMYLAIMFVFVSISIPTHAQHHRHDGSCVTCKPCRPCNPCRPCSLNSTHNGVYIKIGKDKSGVVLGKKVSKKMTVAIFPSKKVKTATIYLYAIPRCCGLVKNYQTLIGYAKNVEVVNGQAQFTKHWDSQLRSGRYLARSEYNVYAEFIGYDAEAQIVCRKGRYWGGNHRKWTVKVR